ncbi:MAG: VanZ family protein [Prevotella sp.]|nr:VanZ family protein [Prevotella sp.]MCM1074770.1 VanZ family protein [Ruminococcus sp.]
MIKLLYRIPVAVCSLLTMGAIFWLTLAPKPVGDVDVPLFPGADKLIHAVMFGGLAWMFYIDLEKISRRRPCKGGVWGCAAVSIAIGASVEWLQRIMELGRSLEWTDLGADAAGTVLASILILWLRKE